MKNKGFTLIEISLALVIISVLLGLSITLMKNLSRNNRYKAIKNRVENVRETIIGYVLEKGRFPFADIDNDGKEDPNYYTGKVPYKTLGLSKVEVSDSYGFMIDYDVAGGTGIQGSLANTSFRNICHQLGAYIDHNNTSPVLVTLDGGNSWIEVPFILMVRGIDKVYDSELFKDYKSKMIGVIDSAVGEKPDEWLKKQDIVFGELTKEEKESFCKENGAYIDKKLRKEIGCDKQ
jgi:prepilin-type N-terminal cleavage/methylation domain-containing protein